jgi:hypothetical protein
LESVIKKNLLEFSPTDSLDVRSFLNGREILFTAFLNDFAAFLTTRFGVALVPERSAGELGMKLKTIAEKAGVESK